MSIIHRSRNLFANKFIIYFFVIFAQRGDDKSEISSKKYLLRLVLILKRFSFLFCFVTCFAWRWKHSPESDFLVRKCWDLNRLWLNSCSILFSPISSFVDRELAKVNEVQSQRWGFDFTRGLPIANNNAQFQWEQLMTPKRDDMPEMYTLTRLAHTRRTECFFSADEDSDAANSSDELQDKRARRSNECRRYEEEVETVPARPEQQLPAHSVLLSPPTSVQSSLSSDSEVETRNRRQTTVPTVPRTRQARITGEWSNLQSHSASLEWKTKNQKPLVGGLCMHRIHNVQNTETRIIKSNRKCFLFTV
jgi:Cyclin-dependent kinase inhibitor